MVELPEWLIGDSPQERTFLLHLHFPRFIAEVLDDERIEVVEFYDQRDLRRRALARLMRRAWDFYLSEMDREA